jgi:hypothetical protein
MGGRREYVIAKPEQHIVIIRFNLRIIIITIITAIIIPIIKIIIMIYGRCSCNKHNVNPSQGVVSTFLFVYIYIDFERASKLTSCTL